MKRKYRIIKKGFKFIIHSLAFLSNKKSYHVRLRVHDSWKDMDEQYKPKLKMFWNKYFGRLYKFKIGSLGHNKIWGVIIGWVHWSSYRVTFLLNDGKIDVGYYCWVNNKSPQERNIYKGIAFRDVKPGDLLYCKVTILHKNIGIEIRNLTTNERRVMMFPKSKMMWLPKFRAFPNIKNKAKSNMLFDFVE